ncbi:unnamed protein product, partial [Protopolystoma xenopodis]
IKGCLRKRYIESSAATCHASSETVATSPLTNRRLNQRERGDREQAVSYEVGVPAFDDQLTPNLTGSNAIVLLDQNLVNTSLESPIYLRLHSKV